MHDSVMDRDRQCIGLAPAPLGGAFVFEVRQWASGNGLNWRRAKVIVWDIVLGLSTTDPIGDDVAEWAVVTAYVGGRSLEKIARKRAAITLPAVD